MLNLIPTSFVRKMHRMRRHSILTIGQIVIAICLIGFTSVATPSAYSDRWRLGDLFANHQNIWRVLARGFSLQKSYLDNDHVKKQIRWFLTQPAYLSELTHNAEPYLYYMLEQVRQRHMPFEIALLPMIESNYNPFVHSKKGAAGLWQLMPNTATGFGLKINDWYDGRRDIVTSTNTALNYLQYLHDYFHSWLLAIAAYDSGEGTVLAAIHYNQRHGRSTDFWNLPLPQETQQYIPKLLALAAVIKNHTYYGVHLTPIDNKPTFASVTLKTQMNLDHLAQLAHTPTTLLRQLNPGFRRQTTMPHHEYHVLIPIDKVDLLAFNLAALTTSHLVRTDVGTHHRVRPGESLSVIASRYDTSIAALRKTNKLETNVLQIGENLLIPTAHAETIVLETPHQSPTTTHKSAGFYHKVKSGDTLSGLAHRFGTRVAHLRHANHLRNDLLQIGTALWIPYQA